MLGFMTKLSIVVAWWESCSSTQSGLGQCWCV